MGPSNGRNLRYLTLGTSILAGAALLAVASTPVGAASTKAAKTDLSPIGSWRFTISQSEGQGSPALVTFGADGTLIVSDPPVSSDGGGVAYDSTGHGVWQSSGPDAFAFTFEELESTPQGGSGSDLTVDATGTLDASSDTMSGQFVLTVQGPDGTVYAHVPGTFTGTAIGVEPMPALDAGMSAAGSPAPGASTAAG